MENNVKDDMIIMENLIPKVIDNLHQKASIYPTKLSLILQGFVFIDQGWLGEGGEQQEAHVDLTVPPLQSSLGKGAKKGETCAVVPN